MNTPPGTSPAPLARMLKTLAAVEPLEVRAVLLSMFYFLFLFGSYSVVKPVRDAMGTVYGVKHLQELFTATLIASLVFSPLYAGLASPFLELQDPIHGILGLVILFVGLRIAWQLTAEKKLDILGPFSKSSPAKTDA